MAIIGDLDELETTFFDGDLDTGRSGVERILEQLFDSVGRSMDDLSVRQPRCTKHVDSQGTHLCRRDSVDDILL